MVTPWTWFKIFKFVFFWSTGMWLSIRMTIESFKTPLTDMGYEGKKITWAAEEIVNSCTGRYDIIHQMLAFVNSSSVYPEKYPLLILTKENLYYRHDKAKKPFRPLPWDKIRTIEIKHSNYYKNISEPHALRTGTYIIITMKNRQRVDIPHIKCSIPRLKRKLYRYAPTLTIKE